MESNKPLCLLYCQVWTDSTIRKPTKGTVTLCLVLSLD